MDEDWAAQLKAGNSDAAWDQFLGLYRGVVVAAARRVVHDHDDVMDVFSRVCELLREDDYRRLRDYAARPFHTAKPATWLATVTRNAAIDWTRQREGRRRLPAVVLSMPERTQRLYRYLFHRHMSQVEAFETLRSESPHPLPFREFLADLRALYRALPGMMRSRTSTNQQYPHDWDFGTEPVDPTLERERTNALESALQMLSPADRLVLELYVIEGLPAEDVARITGLRGAKAVYNHSYRALAVLRTRLKGGDLDPTGS